MTVELFLGIITIIVLACIPLAPIWLLLLEHKYDLKHEYLKKNKKGNNYEKIN